MNPAHRKVRYFAARIVAGALLALIAGELLVKVREESLGPLREFQNTAAQVQRDRLRDRRCDGVRTDIVGLGSSAAGTALIPHVVERHLPDIEVVNSAVMSSFGKTHITWLEEIVLAEASPAAVMLLSSPADLVDVPGGFDVPLAARTDVAGWFHPVHQHATKLSALARRRNQLGTWQAAAALLGLERPPTDFEVNIASWQAQFDADGWWTAEADAEPAEIREPDEVGTGRFDGDLPSAEIWADAAATLQSRGITVVWVLLPSPEARQVEVFGESDGAAADAIRKWAAVTGIEVIDVREVAPVSQIMATDQHLNRQGAEAVSEALGRQLRTLGLPSGRTPPPCAG